MKQLKAFLFVSLAGLLLLTLSCSKEDTYNNGSDGGGDNNSNVTMQSSQFQPATLTVLLGSTVTWTNLDSESHTIVSDDGTSFNSGTIASQGKFTYTASVTGTYNYHCTLHPEMKGTLLVVTR